MDTLLQNATIQEIQLELLRRTSYNALSGERVAASLRNNSALWTAAMLDRLTISEADQPPRMGLIKLRDLQDDIWNADTLYILCPDAEKAHRLADIAESEDWAGDVCIWADSAAVDSALGSCGRGAAIVRVWWD